MKLAVIGASGRTGLGVMRAALAQGLEPYPVLESDRQLGPLSGMVPAGHERYADFTSTPALVAALHGCTHAIAAIQPRCMGPGFPIHDSAAVAAMLAAVDQLGMEKLLWCSTMGAFHWSLHLPSKQAYELEYAVKCSPGRWGIAKFSAYHDEILEAYVAPRDGGRPRSVPSNGHWAPLSRDDAGRLLLACLGRIPDGRVQCLGGPELLMADELAQIVAQRAHSGRGRATGCPGVPEGDHAVMLEDTLTTAGMLPSERLGPWLDAQLLGGGEPELPASVYPRGDPGPSSLDVGGELPLWDAAGPVLRRVVHELIGADLVARGLSPAQLDFSGATARAPHVEVHGGTLSTMRGVRALDAQGAVILQGEVNWLRDELAEELRVFFGRRIPDAVWDELDVGVRRRLADEPRYRRDKRVLAYT